MVLWWGAMFSGLENLFLAVPENLSCGSGEPLKRVPQKRSGESFVPENQNDSRKTLFRNSLPNCSSVFLVVCLSISLSLYF